MKRRMLSLAAVLVPVMCQVAAACPFCKDADSSNGSTAAPPSAGGYNHSIYLMLGGLAFAIGMVARTVIKGIQSSPGSLPVRRA